MTTINDYITAFIQDLKGDEKVTNFVPEHLIFPEFLPSNIDESNAITYTIDLNPNSQTKFNLKKDILIEIYCISDVYSINWLIVEAVTNLFDKNPYYTFLNVKSGYTEDKKKFVKIINYKILQQ